MCKKPNLIKIFKEKLMQYLHYLKSKNVTIDLNSLQDKYYSEPIVTCVKGSNGKEDHTAAIYTWRMFDGNFNHAIPLCKKALDYCCSSDDEPCKFVEFRHSFQFEHFNAYVTQYGVGDENEQKCKRHNKYKKKKQKKIIYVIQ